MRAWPIFCTAIFQAPETRAGRVMCHTGPSPRRLALVISGSSGSRLPMITALLQKTLESRRESFERLILEIVRAGVTYRQKQRLPIQAEEIEQLNGLLLDVGFKFPELWDPDFHASLRMGSAQRAKERVETALQEERVRATHESRRSAELRELRDRFFVLGSADSRQKAGFELEKILNRLFALHGLAPREPFRRDRRTDRRLIRSAITRPISSRQSGSGSPFARPHFSSFAGRSRASPNSLVVCFCRRAASHTTRVRRS